MKGGNLSFVGTVHLQGKTPDSSIVFIGLAMMVYEPLHLALQIWSAYE